MLGGERRDGGAIRGAGSWLHAALPGRALRFDVPWCGEAYQCRLHRAALLGTLLSLFLIGKNTLWGTTCKSSICSCFCAHFGAQPNLGALQSEPC